MNIAETELMKKCITAKIPRSPKYIGIEELLVMLILWNLELHVNDRITQAIFKDGNIGGSCY